ncbi:MAG TPA: hypothetical protein EYN70_10365 [Planctomycetaceae bacterium]|nr:hypothetical protein [Planctomycetaceae bacterium]
MPSHVSFSNRWCLLIRFSLVFSCLCGSALVFAADNGKPALPTSAQWLQGRAFQQQLQKPLQANWSGLSLQHLTSSIAANQRICIFLDRQVDPDQTVNFRATGASLERTLQQLAQQLKLGTCKIGACIYVGPVSTTSRLATISEVQRQQLRDAPAALKPQLMATGWQWKQLSNPQSLLEQQVQAAGLMLDPTVRLPHDLWKEQTFPPLDFAQRLTIVLAGFNLTFHLDLASRQVHLIPLPERVSLTRSYTKQLSAANLAKVKKRFPQLIIKQTGNRLEAQGSYEDHELLSRLLSGETIRTSTTKPGEKRFTLRVMKAPAAAIIDSVVQQQQWTVRFEPAIATRLKTLVTLKVTEATLDELLEKTLDPLGLTYQLKDQQLTITEKRP